MRWKLVVLVVVLLAVLWVVAIFVPDLLWFAETLTALAIAIPVLVLLGLWARERVGRARAPSPPPGALARGADRRERAAARRQLRSAIAEQRRARGGRAAADRMPWYLVMGPPGSGKSSVLEQFGLTRLSPASAPEPFGPSRLQVWCSADAVFVEVASESLADSERERWVSLLAELRGLRGDRPVEGIVVTLGAPDLTGAGDAMAKEVGALRARIDEAVEGLGLVLPVYVVVSKMDTVEGFAEFWAEDPTSRDSTWGASFGAEDDTALHEPGKAVHREFEVLAEALHAKFLERVAQEGDAKRQLKLLRFPAEFRRNEAPLAHLADVLHRPGPAPERFLLRGFYLTSAGEPNGKGRFVGDLLRSVILPDRHLARPTARAAGVRAAREAVVSAAAVGALAVALVPAIVSYVHNVHLARTVEAAGSALGQGEGGTAPGTRGDPVEPALDALARMESDLTGFAVPGWFSPSAARELHDPLEDLYVARLHAWMLRSVRPELERKLDAVALGPPLADSPSTPEERTPLLDGYETVKLCATLASPKGHVAGDWAATHIAAQWRKLLADADALPSERLVEHARRYLAALEKRPALAWSFRSKLAEARERLKRLEVRDIPYRRLLLHGQSAPAVRASDLFGPASLEFLESRGDVQVAGVYTQGGWQKIRDALASPAPWPRDSVVEGWVLEDASVPAEPALRPALRERYFVDFADRWTRFVAELRIRTPKDLDTARRELTAFKAEGFYPTIFAQLKLNLIRDEAGAADAGLSFRLPWFGKSEAEAGPAPAATAVEKAFRPLLAFAGEGEDGKPAASGSPPPLEKYLAILDALKADLGETPSPKLSPDEARSHLLQAKAGVRELLDAVPEGARRTLAQLLLPPIMGGVAAGTSEGQRSLSDDWRSTVYSAWNDGLGGRFPFRASPAAAPANFADFAKFFRPDADGVLWGFVQARLAPMVELKGDGQYAPKPGADALAPEVLLFLTRAQEITDAFFHAGEDPGLKLSLQADWTSPDVTDAKFVVGTKETALPKAQWSSLVRWFGEDVRVEWKESGRAVEQLGRHSFSLFDLLTSVGGLKGLSGTRPLYSAECPPLLLKLRPEGKDALRADFFARVHCPPELRLLGP